MAREVELGTRIEIMDSNVPDRHLELAFRLWQMWQNRISDDEQRKSFWNTTPAMHKIKSAEDSDTVRFHELKGPQNHRIFFPSLEKLAVGIGLVYQSHLMQPLEGTVPKIVKQLLSHEEAHAKVMQISGVRAIKFAIGATDRLSAQVIACGGSCSKLALAASVAAPEELSAGDIKTLHYFGYDGVKDVGRRLETYNKQGLQPKLPLPLSY